MPVFLKNLLQNQMVRAVALKWLRHGLTTAGGALVAYLVSQGASQPDASNLAGELVGVVMTLAGIGLSMWDAKAVSNKIAAAAAASPQTPLGAVDALKSTP